MAWMLPAAIIGSSLLGGSAARNAASVQADAANRASDLQYKQWQESVALQEPWRKAGEQALNKLGTGFTGQVDLTQDPGYAFRLSEGQKALERSAAARGGLQSGSALKAAQRFGQDLGSQEYQNAYNRALTQYNTTAALAGIGQTAAQQQAGYGQTAASNIGNALTGAAQARASGYMGGANAISGGLTNYLNYSNQQNQSQFQNALLNRLYPGSGGGGWSGTSLNSFFGGTGGSGD